MATFSKHQIISVSPVLIPDMAQAICAEFQRDGYEVNVGNLYSGGSDISITKGGMFKAVLGLKTALKITLQPRENAVLFDANVGVFGQQAVPTVISMFFFWPVLLTQIWGLIQQSQLDNRALEAAQTVALQSGTTVSAQADAAFAFCPDCGKPVPQGARFCPACGAAL